MSADITKMKYGSLTPEIVFYSEKQISDLNSLIKSLIIMQKWEIEKISTSSFINQTLCNHLKKSYIEIPITSNKQAIKCDFTNFLYNEVLKKTNNLIFCIGDSGCGKTTLLLKTFLDIQQKSDMVIPIYINLNNKRNLTCNKKQILQEIFTQFKIKVNRVLMDYLLKNYRFIFLLDGLDEKSSILKYSDIEKAIKSRTDDTFIISCRRHFYYNLRIKDIDFLIEFEPINAELGIKYLKSFFAGNPILSKRIEMLSNSIFDSRQKNDVFSNILMLTLLAVHLDESDDYILQLDKRRGTIMDSISTALINREIAKNNLDISFDLAYKIIEEVAIYTFERHHYGRSYLYDLMLQTIKKKVKNIDSDIIEKIISIYVTKYGCTITYKFFHAQFYDFFVAKAFFDAIVTNKKIDKYLKYTFSVDINAFLSDLMRDGDPAQIYKRLERLCLRYLDNPDTINYSKLFLLIMHMQRTGEYAEIYKFAQNLMNSNRTFDVDIESLLLHSKIIGGLQEEDEELYYSKLIFDKDFCAKHIGCPILYYNEELEFRLPNIDDGKSKYNNVFQAYSRHFIKSDIIKHYYIVRRHNLFTIRKLIEKREVVPKPVADFYYSIRQDVNKDKTRFGLKVKAEYEQLMETIRKYPITETDF